MASPLKLANLSLAFTLRYSLLHLYIHIHIRPQAKPLPNVHFWLRVTLLLSHCVARCSFSAFYNAFMLQFVWISGSRAPTCLRLEWMEPTEQLGHGEQCCGGGVAQCHRFSGLFGACSHASMPVPHLAWYKYLMQAELKIKKKELEIGLK